MSNVTNLDEAVRRRAWKRLVRSLKVAKLIEQKYSQEAGRRLRTEAFVALFKDRTKRNNADFDRAELSQLRHSQAEQDNA